MKINELKPGTGVPFMRVQLMSKKNVMDTAHGKICDALVEDDTGTVTLTLWHEQTNFEPGDILVLKNGWAKEWKGVLQVSSGNHGTIEKEK